MIQHVYERVSQARYVSEVIVATDDIRIFDAVEAFGGVAHMTSRNHRSGTDRVAEVAVKTDAEVIVNMQGDEPLLDPGCVDAAVEPFFANPSLLISTLGCPSSSEIEHSNPNVVKVVVDHEGYALYFSRSPIPHFRLNDNSHGNEKNFFKHVGLYVYRTQLLKLLPTLKESVLEKAEALEQLRFLENGYRIRVVSYQYESLAVDTPEDLDRVNEFIKERSWQPNLSS